eukprot:3741531-Alexandrium_andersonii.AAC.1
MLASPMGRSNASNLALRSFLRAAGSRGRPPLTDAGALQAFGRIPMLFQHGLRGAHTPGGMLSPRPRRRGNLLGN